MSGVVRFGVSIEEDLLEKFDELIRRKGYTNRSEAIRDLIRDRLVEEEWETDQETVGTITIVYDHHTRDLMGRLTHLQHSFEGDIKSVLHVHLDHHNCLEVMVVEGPGRVLKAFADRLLATRGVKHGRLTTTTTGRSLPTKAEHHHHHPN
ncbi:MAG: nickel-responsive transcriptional regulator NikR, partial [Gammaproteobacteria bacterium]